MKGTDADRQGPLPSLYLDIALDGKILYDPRGYASRQIDRLLRAIDRAGLYRERTPAGDVWRWREPPQGPSSVEWGD